jgi:ribulose-phosphate 3-epimerase
VAVRIAASILAADFAQLRDEVRAVTDAGVDWIHVDVMDGHFVPNISIGPPVAEAIRNCTTLPLDVHLMITNPERYVADFAKAGADYLSVHQETCPHLHAVVQQIRDAGIKPAVVLNPATPLATLDVILPDIEMVLVMSVNPGFGGQKFVASALDKMHAARRLRQERGLTFLIEVDGGVKKENADAVTAAGADVLVIGTGIFQHRDAGRKRGYTRIVREIRAALKEGRVHTAGARNPRTIRALRNR